MMDLPEIKKLKVNKKRVLVRCDLDVPLLESSGRIWVEDETRLQLAVETIRQLCRRKARVIVIGHLGRPGGRIMKGLSLKPVVKRFSSLLGREIKVKFYSHALGKGVKKKINSLKPGQVLVLENLRFYPGETKNSPDFVRSLADLGDCYVNEAFANSHREHASIVGLPQYLPSAFGLNFLREVSTLNKVYQDSVRPIVLVLGGKKKSKLEAAQALLGWVDLILIGGELVEIDGAAKFAQHKRVKADLTKKGEDINLSSAKEFAQIIKKAGTVIWSGPVGAYEVPRYARGTEIIGKAVASSKAYSVIGGGDTEAALTKLGLVDKIDYVSSGGGAMLSFLALRQALPGINAVLSKK